jgi:hypothetical protein
MTQLHGMATCEAAGFSPENWCDECLGDTLFIFPEGDARAYRDDLIARVKDSVFEGKAAGKRSVR